MASLGSLKLRGSELRKAFVITVTPAAGIALLSCSSPQTVGDCHEFDGLREPGTSDPCAFIDPSGRYASPAFVQFTNALGAVLEFLH